MKKKFLILSLCFTLFFTSINFNKSYADNINPLVVDGGVVSAPLVGTVVTLATATGLVLNSNEDIYKLIYDFRQSNLDNWNNIINSFNNTVSIGANGVVSVGKEFVNYVKDFLDSTYSDIKIDDIIIPFDILGNYQFESWDSYNVPIGQTKYMPTSLYTGVYKKEDMSFLGYGRIYMYVRSTGGINPTYIMGFNVLVDGNFNYGTVSTSKNSTFSINVGFTNYPGTDYYTYVHNGNPSISNPTYLYDITSYNTIGGVYNPGNIDTEDKIDVYVPGNLGDIIGNNYSDTPSYDLPIGGVVTVPGIENPSVDIDDTIPFPGVNVDNPSVPDVDVPNEGIFSNITDYIIGLVVPSDSYWTDTFGGLHSNFINSFPMVDMGSFNSLVVNGKPFPNIDVNIMGSKGRVVNGDTVNSIVDWLRPIISGFIFLCLMFFNYRKLYKLIRNSEPFEGIGKVENHAN